jgi:hypothetical protein
VDHPEANVTDRFFLDHPFCEVVSLDDGTAVVGEERLGWVEVVVPFTFVELERSVLSGDIC